ncbi:MAG: 3-oxoacyl-ACP reductase FabG [Calditrichales bacterium]|nr:MAG: 3-oxoacyl-ACP reductase FabG [Calditrichales bacterium]
MKNRNILITGGSGGLGIDVTRHILTLDGIVTLLVNSEQSIQRLKSVLNDEENRQLRFVKADILDENQVAGAFEQAGPVEVLVHLVGGFAMGETDRFSLQDWQRQIDLNLKSTFLVCKYALKGMKSAGYGRIVTVASRAGLEPSGQLAVYSATKAGVIAFTQAIAAETKGTSITANTIAPGTIDTPANRQAMDSTQAHLWVKPQSLAELIGFLASEKAGDLRGTVIPVYGNS